jgi:Ca2+-binding EF-hand superfamily protein
MNIQAAGMSAGISYMSGASAMAPPQQKMTNLFNQIDSSGAGSINQAQFKQAFQTMNPPAAFQNAGSSQVWNKLDPGGTGQVSQQDFVASMKAMMVQLRQSSNGSVAQSAAASLSALGNSQGILV